MLCQDQLALFFVFFSVITLEKVDFGVSWEQVEVVCREGLAGFKVSSGSVCS